jgi:hypothetical protein
MDRNLVMLERRIDQMERRGVSRRERTRILAALRANGCRDEEPGRVLPPPITAEDGDNVIIGPFPPALSGTYRTLCVRTCDGYYFPISHAATPDLLLRDQQICQARCPGTEVKLYFHQTAEEESEDMVSATGEPYTALPSAFKYREAGFTRPEGCGCSAPAKQFSIIAGNPPEEGERQVTIIGAPVPSPRPESAGEPHSRAGEQDQAGITREPKAADTQPAASAAPAERKVRVVGPVFLPDPEEAIDLRSPGRSDAR